MTHMVTRCPKCATAFRITSTQLESAKGAVRCGSCLHIFKAQEHLTKPVAAALKETTPAVTAPPKAPPITTTPAASPSLEDDDILISDDMEESSKTAQKASEYDFDGFMDIDLSPKSTTSLFDREIRYKEDEEKPEVADESWADELLDELEDDEPRVRKSATKQTANLESVTSETAPLAEIPAAQISTPDSKNTEPYAGPRFSIINEENESQPSNNQEQFSSEFLVATGAAPIPAATTTNDASHFAAALFDEPTPQPITEPSPISKRPVKSASVIRAFDTSRSALLMNIMPAPVEFTAKRMRRWYQEKLWPSLALLMGLLLIVQVAYFKFDYFSRVEPYRSAYAFACPIIGCKVPALINTAQITATNLIVRNHPTVSQALIVDAILINNAPFEQPFPELVLSFSKLNDEPVATRIFSAKDYLSGELAGIKVIPMHQPVHITLELADPGPDAVNYHLSIH